MGSGNQGGSSSAEDGEIRKAFSADPNATAKDARDFFRDRDSGLTANMAYLDSQAAGSGGQSNRDLLERQLGDQGLSLEGQNFVRYDEQGNRSTAGGINQKGNFWGSADLSGVNSPSYLAQNARRTGSRDRRYGANADAMSQGTLAPKIQNSLIDLVTYNPTGTVTGMDSQQVYNPTSLFSGDPNRTYNTNTGLYETDESIGFDDSSPSILGRMAGGAANYVGDGGMMGAVTRGLGGLSNAIGGGNTAESIETPDPINLNPNGFNPMRPELRPTDGISDITSALMGGYNKSQQNRQAGLYDNRGVDVAGPYSGSAINPFINMNIDPTAMSQQGPNFTPQFNAQGVQVPFDGGNRIGAPLGIGTLPRKKTLSELAKTEPVITAGYSGFRNPTNVFDPQQRIIDDAKRPLGDRVSMYEDDPSIAFGFGGEPFDLSEGAESISSVSEPVDFSDRGSELGFVERGRDLNRFPPSVSTPGLIGEDMAERLRKEAAEQDENMYGTGMFDLSDSLKTIPAPFGNELGVPVPESTPYGVQGPPEGVTPPLPIATDLPPNTVDGVNSSMKFGFDEDGEIFNSGGYNDASPSGVLPSQIERLGAKSRFPDFGSEQAGGYEDPIARVIADARTNRLEKLNVSKLGTATGSENNQVLENARTTEYLDPRIQDAMAPDGLNDNMYNDGSEIFDLSETYDPSGGGFTDGGGGGGGGCPEGYEPMTLENGETVCVPIEEEVTEEEVQETPVTPTVRPAMGPSAYTPQEVSPIRPYTLQPGEQGVGSLADILQLQNYPNIV